MSREVEGNVEGDSIECALIPGVVGSPVSEGMMDVEGTDIWEDVREQLVAEAPLRILRALAKTGDDLADKFDAFLEDEDALGVLEVLGEPLLPGTDPREAAVEAWQRLVAGQRRFSGQRRARVAQLVIQFFDAWAAGEDDPGAVAGRIICARSRALASWAFDSGYPGSGQTISAHRYQGAVVTIGFDYAVCGFYGSIQEVLRDWLESGADDRQIFGPSVSPGLLERLQRQEDEDEDDVEEEEEEDEEEVAARAARAVQAAEERERNAPSAARDAHAAEEHERTGDVHAADSDYVTAGREWRLAASFGSASANWKLAILFCRGAGAQRDPVEAARRCRSAAEANDPRAQLHLARASERMLKYEDSDLWQKLAADSGVSSPGLTAARRRRTEGTRAQRFTTTIERLFTKAEAGHLSAVVDLVALLAVNGRLAEAQRWWAHVETNRSRLRVSDALVLELSRARDRLGEAAAV
jgi:hypothetical protein